MTLEDIEGPTPEMDPVLGLTIKGLREEKGLSQADLESRAALETGLVARIESAMLDPIWQVVEAIAHGLTISTEELSTAVELRRRSEQLTKDAASNLAQAAKSLAHPLRVRIVNAMPPGEMTSPSDLAEALEDNLGTVSYHVRTLGKAGVLTVVDKRPVRGTMEHFYAFTNPDAWSNLANVTRAWSNAHHSALEPATEWWWAVGVSVQPAGDSGSC